MKLAGRFLLLGGILWITHGWADDDSIALLKRMNHAASSLNFDGVFLHVDDQHLDTLRVIHKIQNGKVLERLYALNGNPREVIRDAERVWCFMPERKMGHAGLRSTKQTGFPGFMVKNLDGLASNYILTTGNVDRIADRTAIRLKILPRDAYRYGYELWADQETGLLLKSVLIDHASNAIEQYMYAFINIGIDIPDSDLLPMTSKEELEWFNDKKPPKMMAVADSPWYFDSLPDGYNLINIMQRSMPMDDKRLEHMVLSDGLAGISVFIEKTENPAYENGIEQMGAVNAYTRTIDEWQVTVIGEVPAVAVKLIGEALALKH
jgi:sigma-E factor negative regulatory protein RseB